MHGDPAAGFYPECTDLSWRSVRIEPDSGESTNAGACKSECGKCLYHGLLKCSHVLVDIGKKIFEIDDGIHDQLTRAVIGDVAATIDRIIGGVYVGKLLDGNQEIFFIA